MNQLALPLSGKEVRHRGVQALPDDGKCVFVLLRIGGERADGEKGDRFLTDVDGEGEQLRGEELPGDGVENGRTRRRDVEEQDLAREDRRAELSFQGGWGDGFQCVRRKADGRHQIELSRLRFVADVEGRHAGIRLFHDEPCEVPCQVVFCPRHRGDVHDVGHRLLDPHA